MMIYKTTACGISEMSPQILEAIDKTRFINLQSIRDCREEIIKNSKPIKKETTKEINYDRV